MTKSNETFKSCEECPNKKTCSVVLLADELNARRAYRETPQQLHKFINVRSKEEYDKLYNEAIQHECCPESFKIKKQVKKLD